VTVLTGTSGWQYTSWRDRFYPPKLPQRLWLQHYVQQFATVEINSTFYNLPTEQTVQRWADAAPPDFHFVVKASRYLTHVRRLRDPEEPVQLMLERCGPLGDRLSCVLVQLPPRFPAQPELLARTLRAFPPSLRVAVEFRDRSWFSDEVRALLSEHNAALCTADRQGEQSEPPWHTASWAYIRFHEGDGNPHPCYTRKTLRTWAQRLRTVNAGADPIYVFFNNDPLCCAPRDAAVLSQLCSSAGMAVTRAPQPAALRW
jgi:uncharacterized protein YecE (DUF72 family)